MCFKSTPSQKLKVVARIILKRISLFVKDNLSVCCLEEGYEVVGQKEIIVFHSTAALR